MKVYQNPLMKFAKENVHYYHGEYHLSMWMRNMNKLTDGRITLSFKQKKKRILVSGRLILHTDWGHYSNDWRISHDYEFKPNNEEKLKKALTT